MDSRRPEEPTLSGPVDQERAPSSRHLLLYVASSFIILIVCIATFLPALVGGSEYLYNPASLTVVYATLSLAVAMITFGVIADSGAVLEFDKPAGTAIQLGGSAAAFVVFFYLFSGGLNPYKELQVFLYKGSDQLMGASDGAIEVTLASHIVQKVETANGHARFSLPRQEQNIRLRVNSVSGQLWELGSLSPDHCVAKGNRISGTCDSIDARLVKAKGCLSKIKLSSYEVKPINTTLATVLDTLKENLQNVSIDLPVSLQFSDALIEQGIHKVKFKLERKNQTTRRVCEHMAAIENEFNWSRGKREVTTYLSCDKMLVTLANEAVQKEYNPCL